MNNINANNMNPTIIVEDVTSDNRTFHVIRDDYLPGGTKQRLLPDIISDDYDEYIYAGPAEGYAQVALSYVALKMGKKATIIISRQNNKSEPTTKARNNGAKIIELTNNGKRADLEYVRNYSINYAAAGPQTYTRRFNLSFGLFTEEYIDILAKNITKALPQSMIENPPNWIWLVGGSGMILQTLYKVFPNSCFGLVQVGKTFYTIEDKKAWSIKKGIPFSLESTYNPDNTELHVYPKKFWQSADILPPYPSVATYDAKLWKFVLENGENGDYIWNVAGPTDRR